MPVEELWFGSFDYSVFTVLEGTVPLLCLGVRYITYETNIYN
jgi:hypothetical protein